MQIVLLYSIAKISRPSQTTDSKLFPENECKKKKSTAASIICKLCKEMHEAQTQILDFRGLKKAQIKKYYKNCRDPCIVSNGIALVCPLLYIV